MNERGFETVGADLDDKSVTQDRNARRS